MGIYGQSDIKAKVLKVIREHKTSRSLHRVRIVVWVINGHDTEPRLERREIRKDKYGGEYEGNNKGLTHDDIVSFLAERDENLDLMQVKPAYKAPEKHFAEPTEENQ